MILDYFKRRREMKKWEENCIKEIDELAQRVSQDLQTFEFELMARDSKEVDERKIDILGCRILGDIITTKNLSEILRCWGKREGFCDKVDEKNREYCERTRKLFGESIFLLGHTDYAQNQKERLLDLERYIPQISRRTA